MWNQRRTLTVQMCAALRIIAMVAALAASAWPQASTGRVSGTVRDQSGAVIPSRPVALTNVQTNATLTAPSNEAGFYLFPSVVPGSYRLTVEVPGMQRYEGAFIVQVSQSVVIDPVLKPGQTTTTLEVKDVTPLLTLDNPTLRNTLERSRIEQLPINGRGIGTLLSTQPGFEGQRVFGSPVGGNEFVLDGSIETDLRWSNNPGSLVPGLDSVQEFTLETNAVPAKYSRPVSVIISTKSGTNQIHGSAFETNRNNGLGLARRREDYYAQAPKDIRNEFGVSAGGPLIIPKLYNGKDKTFWFAAYEGHHQQRGSTNGFKVPTMAMRNGDFSGLKDSQGRLQTLYDPWTTDPKTWARQPFNYGGKLNVIDPQRISPVTKYLYSITPLPTNDVNPNIDINWWGPVNSTYRNWTFASRFDHRFSDRDLVYVRASWTDNWQAVDLSGAGLSAQQMLNGVAGWEIDSNAPKSIATSWAHTFSPTFFSELLLSAHRDTWYGGNGSAGGVNWSDKLNLPNPFNTPLWPIFDYTGLGGQGSSGTYSFQVNDTKRNFQNYFVVDENATKIKGKHELQFGIHYRRDQLNIQPQQRFPQAQMNYDTSATALFDPTSNPSNPSATPYTGHNIANMYLGLSRVAATLSHGWYYLRESEFAPYFQDNFKATPRLTLNMGLRWEYWPSIREKNNVMIGFDRTNHKAILGTDLNTMYKLGVTLPSVISQLQAFGMGFETYKEAGLPQALMYPEKKNFGPRLGFAYRALDGKAQFVIRGGYSLSYFRLGLRWWMDNVNYTTPLRADFNYNPNDAAQAPDGLRTYLMRSVPAYVDGVNTRNIIDLNQPRGITRGWAQNTYLNPNEPTARSETWNLTLEKEIMRDTLARARYLGTRGTNLQQYYQFNDNTPDYIWYATTKQSMPTGAYSGVARRFFDQNVWGTLREFRPSGWSNYNAVEMDLQRRFSKGYAYQVSYVVGNYLLATDNVTEVNQFMPGLVPADYDQRNALLNYRRDPSIPKHRVRWNWLVDLPIGKDKWIGRNAGNFLNKIIGGWQIAGLGSLNSTYVQLPTSDWNLTGEKVQSYGYQYPIQDCRSGACIPGYLWWNAYIPANRINSVDANGKPNGVMGVPSNYKPAVTPLSPVPANMPTATGDYETNNVYIPLNNGTTQRVGINTGLHPWRNQYICGPRQWGLDASLFKSVNFGERLKVRLNADFFNVLNHPGNPNAGSNGILATRTSGQAPRQLQLTLRLSW